MFGSIFKRLFVTHILFLGAVLVIMSLTVTNILNHITLTKQAEELLGGAEIVERWTGYYQIENHSLRSNYSYKEKLSDCAQLLDCDIIVTDIAGRVFDTTNKGIKEVPADFTKKIKDVDFFCAQGNFGGIYDERVLTVGVPMRYMGNVIGGIYLNCLIPDMHRRSFLFTVTFFIALLITAFFVAVLVYFQAKNISKSLRRINSAALDIAAGNYPPEIPVTSKDEIGQLASSFNFMSASLQKLENMRSRFLSDVSHELRTPMTSICGFIQGILDGTIPPEKHNEYLKIVLDEASRLTRLVNDMLDMTKMQSSEYKLNVSEFDLNELVRHCIISLEQKITDKDLDLDVIFDSNRLDVCADKDAIQRVLINLMDNAIKFSYPDTIIKIHTYIKDKKAYYSIGNFGTPIKREDLTHMFDRFYKADLARNNKNSGAGLGLSFVKNIITIHKQKIWVRSNPTEENKDMNYTEFTFTLELK